MRKNRGFHTSLISYKEKWMFHRATALSFSSSQIGNLWPVDQMKATFERELKSLNNEYQIMSGKLSSSELALRNTAS